MVFAGLLLVVGSLIGMQGHDGETVKRLAMEPLASHVVRCLEGVCEGPAAKATQATLAASRIESTFHVGINGDHCIELMAQ